jgi:hypothetical protein
MELDDGSNGAGHHGDNTNENSSDKGSGPVTQQNTSSNGTPQRSNGQTSGKQVMENLEARRTHYAGHSTDMSCNVEFQSGNFVNSSQEILSSNDIAHVENKSNIVLPSNADFDVLHGPVPSSEALHGTFAVSDLTGVQGNVTGSKPTTIEFQLDNGSQQNQPLVTLDRDEVTMGLKATLSDFVLSAPKPTKRSKRREDSVDEDSCTRAERLKAKKNLDGPGTSKSKSFLSFSDSRIALNITTLGISIGDDLLESIGNLKAL